ncbi:hypothetical protein EHYA_00068 [Embleya hyalina]|uniref:Uncharacterized protein n=1 Tax=Embleya hyalina TaxID=516124 RepID=A0A401YCW6_9ACTN|nr:hypothetical protein EHYA_00068 [Embleya hyalina]
MRKPQVSAEQGSSRAPRDPVSDPSGHFRSPSRPSRGQRTRNRHSTPDFPPRPHKTAGHRSSKPTSTRRDPVSNQLPSKLPAPLAKAPRRTRPDHPPRPPLRAGFRRATHTSRRKPPVPEPRTPVAAHYACRSAPDQPARTTGATCAGGRPAHSGRPPREPDPTTHPVRRCGPVFAEQGTRLVGSPGPRSPVRRRRPRTRHPPPATRHPPPATQGATPAESTRPTRRGTPGNPTRPPALSAAAGRFSPSKAPVSSGARSLGAPYAGGGPSRVPDRPRTGYPQPKVQRPPEAPDAFGKVPVGLSARSSPPPPPPEPHVRGILPA